MIHKAIRFCAFGKEFFTNVGLLVLLISAFVAGIWEYGLIILVIGFIFHIAESSLVEQYGNKN